MARGRRASRQRKSRSGVNPRKQMPNLGIPCPLYECPTGECVSGPEDCPSGGGPGRGPCPPKMTKSECMAWRTRYTTYQGGGRTRPVRRQQGGGLPKPWNKNNGR